VGENVQNGNTQKFVTSIFLQNAIDSVTRGRPPHPGICRVRIRDALKLANEFPVFCGADLSHLPTPWIPALRRVAAGLQYLSAEWGVPMRITGIESKQRAGRFRLQTSLYEFSGHPRFTELALLEHTIRDNFEVAVSDLG
jgi:hypothetical protein